MKYIKRLLLLPFAWILWTVYYSIKWVRYGGQLQINSSEEVINPKELLAEIKRLNDNLEKNG